jgi:hypothetical protein
MRPEPSASTEYWSEKSREGVERAFAGGGGHGSHVRRLAELAKIVSIDGKPAWEQEWVHQQLAQFIIECEAAH